MRLDRRWARSIQESRTRVQRPVLAACPSKHQRALEARAGPRDHIHPEEPGAGRRELRDCRECQRLSPTSCPNRSLRTRENRKEMWVRKHLHRPGARHFEPGRLCFGVWYPWQQRRGSGCRRCRESLNDYGFIPFGHGTTVVVTFR
jgi:hypothetical protein